MRAFFDFVLLFALAWFVLAVYWLDSTLKRVVTQHLDYVERTRVLQKLFDDLTVAHDPVFTNWRWLVSNHGVPWVFKPELDLQLLEFYRDGYAPDLAASLLKAEFPSRFAS